MNDKGQNSSDFCLDFVQEFGVRLWGVGGARPPPFTISTIAYKVVAHVPAERADTLLYPYMYSVVSTGFGNNEDGPIIN